MIGITLLKIIGVLFLIFLNGFFVSVEFAVVATRHTRIDQMVAEGGKTAAQVVSRWLASEETRDRIIAAAQLGITVASLALGYLGEKTMAALIEPVLHPLLAGQTWLGTASRGAAAVIGALPLLLSLTIVTGLHVIMGEQIPKVIAIRIPEQVALTAAWPMELFMRIFHPFIWMLDHAAASMLRLLGFQPLGHHVLHTAAEIIQLVEESEAGGILGTHEREMIHAVFELGDVLARQVMVPRTEMISVPADASLDNLVALARQYPLTKFPVYEGDLDHIIGIMHTKDLVRVLGGHRQDTSARGLMREALFLPESISVDELLSQFRKHHQHIAILLDEYGGTAGLVTLEDLLEEIVGDVKDPFDAAEPEIKRLPDGSAALSGLLAIEEVNEAFGLTLSDPNYDTIAGFVLGRLERMATVGDTVEANGVRLRVEALDGLRIARLSLFPKKDGNDEELSTP